MRSGYCTQIKPQKLEKNTFTFQSPLPWINPKKHLLWLPTWIPDCCWGKKKQHMCSCSVWAHDKLAPEFSKPLSWLPIQYFVSSLTHICCGYFTPPHSTHQTAHMSLPGQRWRTLSLTAQPALWASYPPTRGPTRWHRGAWADTTHAVDLQRNTEFREPATGQ